VKVLKFPYFVFNIIIAGIIAMIMLYSGIFSAEKANHPVSSFYTRATGQETISTGLSRSFSAIVRGKFAQAQKYNPHGFRVFIFFASQLMGRVVLMLYFKQAEKRKRTVIIWDSIFSVALYLVCFYPFIEYTINALCAV